MLTDQARITKKKKRRRRRKRRKIKEREEKIFYFTSFVEMSWKLSTNFFKS